MAKPFDSFQQISALRKLPSTIFCWMLLACINLPVLAEETALPEDAVSGGSSVLILATTPSRLEEPVEDTSGSVSVITTPEIEVQNPTTVPDVLRDLPGVSLQESGTLGESASFSLRGAEPSQTLVLLDGIRVNSPFRGGFDLGNFLVDEIGQVEIVRGAQSALYGSEAIGGVVNLRAGRAIRPLEISLVQEAGNEGTFREALSVGGKESQTDFSLTFSHTDTDGQFDHDRFGALTLGGNIGVPVRESGRLQFTYRFQEDHKELAIELLPDEFLPGPVTPMTVDAVFDNNSELNRRFLFNSIGYQDKITNWFGLSWKAALVDTHLNQDDPTDSVNPSPFPYLENTDTRTLILDLQQNLYMGNSDIFSFGVEGTWDKVDSKIEGFGFSFPSLEMSRRNMAYYLQNLYKGQKRWVLQTGVRIDDNSSFETVVTPKVSTAYEFESTKTKFRGSWGLGYRAPTIQEQFFPVFGNPELEPEKSMSWEVGLQQRVVRETILLDTAYFWIDYDNLIQKDPTSVANQKAISRGVESILEIRSLPALTVKANYTYLDAKNKTTGRKLPFRSRHRGNISLLYAPLVNLTMNLDINLVSSQALSVDFILPDGTILHDRSPGFARVDLSGTYYLFGNFLGFRETRFFIKVRNLFDQDYQDVPGFPAPGRGILGGVTVTF